MRKHLALAVAFVVLAVSGWAGSPMLIEGTWSAPSLSQPSTPVIFSLFQDGSATEQVGSYRGTGTWKLEDGTVKIAWTSGWTAELRRLPTRKFELLTWKKGSSPEGPPDDIQPAQRIGATVK